MWKVTFGFGIGIKLRFNLIQSDFFLSFEFKIKKEKKQFKILHFKFDFSYLSYKWGKKVQQVNIDIYIGGSK